MIPAARQEILRELERLSELAPDLRFGQMIANLAFLTLGPTNEAIWDVEDEELLASLRRLIGNLSGQEQGVA